MASIKFELILDKLINASTIDEKRSIVNQYNNKALRNVFIATQHPTLSIPAPTVSSRDQVGFILENFLNSLDYYFFAENLDVAQKNINRSYIQMNNQQYDIIKSIAEKKLNLGIDGNEFYSDILPKMKVEETKPIIQTSEQSQEEQQKRKYKKKDKNDNE